MTRPRVLLAAILLLVTAAACPVPGSAQISPGELSRPHADLDGPTKCLTCHEAEASGMDRKCLDCHRPIERLRSEARGFHGLQTDQECARCHPEHAGRDFELIDWGKGGVEAFDHAKAGWPLQGKHGELECRACHKPEFRRVETPAPGEAPLRADSWLGLETRCTHCHQDPHGGGLGEDCRRCHGAEAWKPALGFDHDRTEFPLRGRHGEVPCAGCHAAAHLDLAVNEAGDRVPLYRPLAHEDCAACHRDPHSGRLGAVCAGCHSETGFRDLRQGSFRHDLTAFPLRGKHAALDCARCHDPERAWGARPAFDRCAACHRDPHAGRATLAGEAVDCASCHDETTFRPAVFSVERHARTAYPLEGRHREVPCAGCHRAKEKPPRKEADPAGVEFRPAFARCRDCHEQAHGDQWVDRPEYADCEPCHTTRGFRPSRFERASHEGLSVSLQGRHGEIPCGACHGPERPGLPPVPPPARIGPAGVWLRMGDTPCAACHVDPHRPIPPAATADTFERGKCEDCHAPEGFRPSEVTPEDHAAFSFPLEGSHLAVPCIACHPELGEPPLDNTLVLASTTAPALSFSSGRNRCRDCHASPHGNQFRDAQGDPPCERCHGVEVFAPATRFDHDRDTRFPLTGAHAGVRCGACHRSEVDEEGAEFVVFRLTPGTCADCHAEGTLPPGSEGRRGGGGPEGGER